MRRSVLSAPVLALALAACGDGGAHTCRMLGPDPRAGAGGAYATRTRSPGGSRGVSVSVGSAEVIEQLISWQAPRISGLGDEAHGADASDGLAVRQGKLGLEVTVDLGQSASNAENLAAEEALARRLLGRLPG